MSIKDAVLSKLEDRDLFRDQRHALSPAEEAICAILDAKFAQMEESQAKLRSSVESTIGRPLVSAPGLESMQGGTRYDQE